MSQQFSDGLISLQTSLTGNTDGLPVFSGDLAGGSSTLDYYSYPNAATCPDCGAGMVRYGRCCVCPSCGFEGCGI